MNSAYQEFRPPSLLRQRLVCLWTQEIKAGGRDHVQLVLPDGCIDLLFVDQQAPTVVGPWTKAFTASLPAGTKIVGARWRPGFASTLIEDVASALLNAACPLDQLIGARKASQFGSVAAQVSLDAKRATLESALLSHFAATPTEDQVVVHAVRWMCGDPAFRINDVSRRLGLSVRQFNRRFTAAVGYGPAAFRRIIRFQRLLQLAESRNAAASLADLSAAAGYADQAHMTREVGRLAGASPALLLRTAGCALNMSDLFNTHSAIASDDRAYSGGDGV